MAQLLPLHIIDEIERRWRRRLKAPPQVRRGVRDDGHIGPCPLCNAPARFEPAISGRAVARGEYTCGDCGHVWRNEIQ